MEKLANDLRDEGAELYGFLANFNAVDWIRPTPFKNWTAQDILIHLTFGDWLNIVSISDPDRFVTVMEKRRSARDTGQEISPAEFLDRPLGHGRVLLEQWRERLLQLCQLFNAADPRARMKWAGPDMSIRSAATARLMETWAHGQDIYDMTKTVRIPTDRIRHIAFLGVNTFAWSFINRGIEPPAKPPLVELTGPSGDIWRWNEESAEGEISGKALDFCHVVTQGRNIADVGLHVVGENARRWMAIAQCFAGPAEDPPAPGTRTVCGIN